MNLYAEVDSLVVVREMNLPHMELLLVLQWSWINRWIRSAFEGRHLGFVGQCMHQSMLVSFLDPVRPCRSN